MGRYPDAERMFRRSIEIRPTARAYTDLGTLYYYQGRFREAVPSMEQAVALAPKEYSIWGNLADARRYSPGQAAQAPDAYRRAIELAREALKVNRNDANALSSVALYEASLGGRQQALVDIQRALGLVPSDTGALFAAALVFESAIHLAFHRRQLHDLLPEGQLLAVAQGR